MRNYRMPEDPPEEGNEPDPIESDSTSNG